MSASFFSNGNNIPSTEFKPVLTSENEILDERLFSDSGRTWGQVEKIEFSSVELFSVQYKNDKGDSG